MLAIAFAFPSTLAICNTAAGTALRQQATVSGVAQIGADCLAVAYSPRAESGPLWLPFGGT